MQLQSTASEMYAAATERISEVVLLSQLDIRSKALKHPDGEVFPGLRSPHGWVFITRHHRVEYELDANRAATTIRQLPDPGESFRVVNRLMEIKATVIGRGLRRSSHNGLRAPDGHEVGESVEAEQSAAWVHRMLDIRGPGKVPVAEVEVSRRSSDLPLRSG